MTSDLYRNSTLHLLVGRLQQVGGAFYPGEHRFAYRIRKRNAHMPMGLKLNQRGEHGNDMKLPSTHQPDRFVRYFPRNKIQMDLSHRFQLVVVRRVHLA